MIPAVKLTGVQTVVLCTSTSCVVRSEPLSRFPVCRARTVYEHQMFFQHTHTERTAMWGDIWIRIADYTFNKWKKCMLLVKLSINNFFFLAPLCVWVTSSPVWCLPSDQTAVTQIHFLSYYVKWLTRFRGAKINIRITNKYKKIWNCKMLRVIFSGKEIWCFIITLRMQN